MLKLGGITLVDLIAKGMVKEFRWCRGRNFLWCVEDGGRSVGSSDGHQLVQKPFSAAQLPFTHATRSPRARQIAGSVVCGGYIDIVAGISTRDSAATEKSFVKLVCEGLCGARVIRVEHGTRGTKSRVNYGRDREIAECFVLLWVVYNVPGSNDATVVY